MTEPEDKAKEPDQDRMVIGNPDAGELDQERDLHETEILSLLAEWAGRMGDIEKAAKKVQITEERAIYYVSVYADEKKVVELQRVFAVAMFATAKKCIDSIGKKLDEGKLYGRGAAVTASICIKDGLMLIKGRRGARKRKIVDIPSLKEQAREAEKVVSQLDQIESDIRDGHQSDRSPAEGDGPESAGISSPTGTADGEGAK